MSTIVIRGLEFICGFHAVQSFQVHRFLISTFQMTDDVTIKQWELKQECIREQVILQDTETWQRTKVVARRLQQEHNECDCSNTGDSSYVFPESSDNDSVLTYVAGMDISTPKEGNTENGLASAALVICQMPDLKVVYENCEFVKLSVPYVPGYLSFREGHVLIEAFDALLRRQPGLRPQVILIDGNGTLHPRECGLACFVGVSLDIPCIGVAKNLLCFDGIERNVNHKEKIKGLEKGKTFPLVTKSGKVMRLALKSGEKAERAIYVSVGHKISLETAAWVVSLCSPMHRIPEPIRKADFLSRELLRAKNLDHV